jgi:D-alanine-D-alanine ligase
MRILVLHSDVPPDAPPDEQDTLVTAAAVTHALRTRGHDVAAAAFTPDPVALSYLVKDSGCGLVFNLVESVWGKGVYAPLAAEMLANLGIPFTGTSGPVMAASGDKLLSKRLMARAGLSTAPWAEAPDWDGIDESRRWIVKSVAEDASLGLDDASVVSGREAVIARAEHARHTFGGAWFAEAFVDGREFNVAILEKTGTPEILPIAEMRFEHWEPSRPRIVSYAAKWDDENPDSRNTVRDFTWGPREPQLHAELVRLAKECWSVFGCRGYARVDLRVDETGTPYILELNPNPCLEPGAGFAAAAAQSGLRYADTLDILCRGAIP